ncbi:hypothetical protein ASD19_11185 [Microbacterium sp. Root53]|uniref:hypothetical protein n=1 Tax=Microbacterium sp. Root53 TaxID=1736553 RepID=UPI0007005B1A|nr:hypothetical protein [Microbacterium sp. Root53]KQZ09937.1 hypothetical protein ASD19_11185 [Microbacterium sp. Root53]
MTATSTTTTRVRADRARVTFATVVGTTVEWYDYFVYRDRPGIPLGMDHEAEQAQSPIRFVR